MGGPAWITHIRPTSPFLALPPARLHDEVKMYIEHGDYTWSNIVELYRPDAEAVVCSDPASPRR